MTVLHITEWPLGRDRQGSLKPVSPLPGGQPHTCLFSGLYFISGVTEGLLVGVAHPLPPSLVPTHAPLQPPDSPVPATGISRSGPLFRPPLFLPAPSLHLPHA